MFIICDNNSKTVGVVDPSEAQPIISFLKKENLKLNYILNTHHHFDHIGGNLELKKTYNAEIVGFGMSADAYHMTAPPETAEGAILAMKNALKDAKINSIDIQYINAHGTSTPVGDLAETLAIKKVFGEDNSKFIVSSTKSMTGHLLGAAGAVEAIYSLLAIRDNIIPPTINLDNPGEGCDLNYSANNATEIPITKSISNSFGFGGTNATLVFSELE